MESSERRGEGPDPRKRRMSEPLRLEPEARCDRCSVFGAFELGHRTLCEDCYRLCGSCCPEFGADDLW